MGRSTTASIASWMPITCKDTSSRAWLVRPGFQKPRFSAEAIINHLKYIRRKQAEETDRLNKIRGAVTDMSKPDIYALSVIIILSIIAVELIRHLM